MHNSAGSLPGGGSQGNNIRWEGLLLQPAIGPEMCGYETQAVPGGPDGGDGAGMFHSGPVREAGCQAVTARPTVG
jgi:hypothetical protein